jgi:hypothetical protein
MKSNSLKLICIALCSLLVSGVMAAEKSDVVKKPAAGKGDITMKKNAGGSLELSNVGDDEDTELLVENKDKQKTEATQASPAAADRTETASRNEEPRETVGRVEQRDSRDQRDQRDAPRGENDELAVGSQLRGNEQGASGYSDNGNVAAGAAGGSALATVPKVVSMPSAGDSQSNEITPNPRPATDMAVPNTVDMSSTAGQEKYRNLMAQEAARSAASGTQAGVTNPAAVRRYIATDRATYQKGSGY